jgi:hypothetical protein
MFKARADVFGVANPIRSPLDVLVLVVSQRRPQLYATGLADMQVVRLPPGARPTQVASHQARRLMSFAYV